MKQFSSDIQVFLGTRQFNKLIESEIKSMKDEIGPIKDYELKVENHSTIEKLLKEVEEFGEIKVTECPALLDIRDPKVDHAQIRINVSMSRNISDIKLQLIKTLEIKRKSKTNISGCVILPNGHLLMTNYTKESKLIEYTDTGEHIRDIQVSSKPFDILIDLDRIVVTYGKDNFIEIMQHDTFNIERKISFHDSCMGVSQEDGKLYVVSGYKTIQVLDLSGRQLDKLKVASDSVLNISTGRYKLFYTDVNKNIEHCCRFDGEELWQYEDESITYPCAITVDNNSNVYIVGYVSNTLTVIQHEGKKCKTLLSESDDLIEPTAVYYDKEKDILLLCTE